MNSQVFSTKNLNNGQIYLFNGVDGENNISYRVYTKNSSNKSIQNDDQMCKENINENISFDEICLHSSVNGSSEQSLAFLGQQKKKGKRRKRLLKINLTNCKYECVRRVAKKFGFQEVEDTDDWTLSWTDGSVSLEKVFNMKKYQKINHFPGMSEICRKDLLARNMNRLWKQFPKDFVIFPRTWCIPADSGDFLTFCRAKKNKTFIFKPDSGSQGKGIYLAKNLKNFKLGSSLICQQYLSRPFLIDGFKFDLRIYVVVTSCNPLRIFVHKDGLARFATIKYAAPANNNLNNVFMHLTNYAIQKNSEAYCRDNETGSKRKISTINKWFRENGYDIEKIWKNIDDIIIKTLITAHPVLKHNYLTCFPNVKGSACFEILGFDIILDRKLKPWILEVNHSPSFTTDSKLDREIKDAVIYDTMVLANFALNDKRRCLEDERKQLQERLGKSKDHTKDEKEIKENKEMEEYLKNLTMYEDGHIGGFRRLYPEKNEEEYRLFFENSSSLFQQTAASKARAECARMQREEISSKKKLIIKSSTRMKIFSDSKVVIKKRLSRSNTLVIKKTKENVILLNSFDPCPINKYEEQERLGNLLRRENLLKSVGLPETVKMLLESVGKISEDIKNSTSNKEPTSKFQKEQNLCGKELTKLTKKEHIDVLSYNHWPSNYLLQRSLVRVDSSNLKQSLTNQDSLAVSSDRDLNCKGISCSANALSNLEQINNYPKSKKSCLKKLGSENNSLCNGSPGLRISSSYPARIKCRANVTTQNAISFQYLNQSPYTQRMRRACNNIRIKQIQLLKRSSSSVTVERRVSSTN